MAITNLKEFNNEWVLLGFLFFCLMTFTVIFMNNNNSEGLGDSSGKFNSYNSQIQTNLLELPDNSNSLLNVTGQNNPEAGDLGSSDSVATSYGVFGNAKNFFGTTRLFLSWMFTGTTGKILISVLSGLFGLTGLYFITKWIRTGY